MGGTYFKSPDARSKKSEPDPPCKRCLCGSQLGDLSKEIWFVSIQSFLRGCFSIGSGHTLWVGGAMGWPLCL